MLKATLMPNPARSQRFVDGTKVRPVIASGHRGQRLELLVGLHEQARRAMEGSLHTFTRGAWDIIEPGREFVDNWHLHAICDHLEAVSRGEIKRLVINVPFRTSKSTFVSVAWPAWTWIKNPEHQWLCGSYAQKLAIRDSLKMRRLIDSSWFKEYWPDAVQMSSDQNEKIRFQNKANGYRIAFGMTGGVMGDGGDTVVIDDPHDRQGANSEVQRPEAIDTYDQGIVTRLNDPISGAIVIIMQRLHEGDLAGHVLKEKGWTHLMLPMEYEKERHCKTSIGFSDPRKKEGELLWPKRFDDVTVAKLKQSLGAFGTSGQLQQRPSPAGGGILQTAHFQLWPYNKPLPILTHVLQSYDTAFTDNTANDPTACTVWGTFEHRIDDEVKTCCILLDCWTDNLRYTQLKKRAMDDWKAVYGGDDADPLNTAKRADVVLIEEKGSGISLIQDLQLARLPVHPYNPGKAGKTTRAELTAPMLEADVYFVIQTKKRDADGKIPAKPVAWAQKLLTQCEQFPNGEHDDLVDTFTQANIYMQRTGLLELPAIEEDGAEEIDYHAKKKARINPYG